MSTDLVEYSWPMDKLTEYCPALLSLVCRRGQTRLGAEWEHSPANHGDDRIPTVDARSRKIRPHNHVRTLTDSFQSVYSMGVLPKNAGLASYLVVTIVMCAVTYVLVLNLQHLKNAIFWVRSKIYSLLRTRERSHAEQKV